MIHFNWLAGLFHSRAFPILTGGLLTLFHVRLGAESRALMQRYRAEGMAYHTMSRGTLRFGGETTTVFVVIAAVLLLFNFFTFLLFVASFAMSAKVAADQQAAIYSRYLDRSPQKKSNRISWRTPCSESSHRNHLPDETAAVRHESRIAEQHRRGGSLANRSRSLRSRQNRNPNGRSEAFRISPFAPSPDCARCEDVRRFSSPAPRRPCARASVRRWECPRRIQCTVLRTSAAGHGA